MLERAGWATDVRWATNVRLLALVDRPASFDARRLRREPC
jgi:hypothetical protein